MRDSNNAITRTTILTLLISMVGLPAAILLAYLDYDLININFRLAARSFNVWPWFRGSAAIALICWLWPFYALWRSGGDKDRYEMVLYEWAGLSFFAALFMYPGHERLGVWSDGKALTAIILMVLVQNLSLWLMARVVWREASNALRQA